MLYYPSSDETHFTASEAAATPAPTTEPQSNIATTQYLMMYLEIGVIAIIVAIAIVGLIIIKKHP